MSSDPGKAVAQDDQPLGGAVEDVPPAATYVPRTYDDVLALQRVKFTAGTYTFRGGDQVHTVMKRDDDGDTAISCDCGAHMSQAHHPDVTPTEMVKDHAESVRRREQQRQLQQRTANVAFTMQQKFRQGDAETKFFLTRARTAMAESEDSKVTAAIMYEDDEHVVAEFEETRATLKQGEANGMLRLAAERTEYGLDGYPEGVSPVSPAELRRELENLDDTAVWPTENERLAAEYYDREIAPTQHPYMPANAAVSQRRKYVADVIGWPEAMQEIREQAV